MKLPTFFLLLTLASAASAQQTSWRFDTDGDLQGWTPDNFESVEVTGGFVRMLTKYDPIFANQTLSFDADRYKLIEFRLQSDMTGPGEIFWHGPDEVMTEKRMSRHTILRGDQPQVYRIDMTNEPQWRGTITGFRLDFLNHAGANLALDYIRLLDRSLGVVPNASFENDFDADGKPDGKPDGWTADAADFRLTTDHATEGDRAALMVSGPKPATLTTTVPLDLLGRYAFSADATLEGQAATLRAELTYRDVFGKPLFSGGAELQPARGGARSEFTPPPTAASALLTLTLSPNSRAYLDVVDIHHVVEELDLSSAPIETWRADWIWAADTWGKDNASAYLRKSFDLPVAPTALTDARVELTADDAYQLFVNGRPVTETADTDGWKTPETLDLKPYLKQGRNVIAVLAKDVASAEGFILEGGFVWPNGGLDLFTNGTWKAVGVVEGPGAKQGPDTIRPAVDWQQPAFDDTAWPAAKVIVPAGGNPWGFLPYTALGVRQQIRLVSVQMPKQVAAGASFQVSATIQAPANLDPSTPLRLALLRDGEPVIARAYGAEVVKQVAAGRQLGPLTIGLTRFLPPGDYQLALGYPRTQYVGASPAAPLSVGTLKVLLPKTAEAPVKVEIRRHKGLPTLFINGQPNSFMHYLELTVGAARIMNMERNGLHLYELAADDIGWKGPGEFDYAAWDRKVMQLMTYDPQALIMPTFDLSGLDHRWWIAANPDQACVAADGSTSVGIYGSAGKIISLASTKWRQESGDATRRFVEHCRKAPYGGRLVGWQPCSGVSWEWQHWGSVGDFEPTDYSEPMQQAFRAWTQQRYPNLDQLRAAWKQPNLTFETVAIPTVAQRDGPADRLFRDPQDWQYVIAFYKFFQDVMVDGIEHYGRIIHEADQRRTIVGTYYGYTVTMLSGARRAGDSGHYALHRLLHSDAIDFLMSPLDYSSRAVGEPYSVMSPIGSVLAHDKLWVLQADLRTHLVTEPNQREHGSPPGLAGTVSQLLRAFANATAKGSATQWYDFSNGWIARDPRQGQVIGKLREIGQQWANSERAPDPNGIAVIVDEQTPSAYLSHAFEVNYWLVYRQKETFERVGAPWNLYLMDDLMEGKLPKFRMYVFLNTFHMTGAQRDWIKQNLQRDGRTLLWMYAPGYVDDQSLDANRISQLTGIAMVKRDEQRPWRITPQDLPLMQGLTDLQQPTIKLGPMFVPQDSRAVTLAYWEGTDLPAMAMLDRPECTNLYSATPLLSPTLMKRLAIQAGVPVYTESTEPAFVGGNLLGLHSAAARTEKLHFPSPSKVTDLMTGEILGTKVTDLTVKLEGPQTRLLRIDR